MLPVKKIDLHVHTTASDGTFTPREAVQKAAELGLKAIAVTDHDTVEGHAEAGKAAAALGIELVPGIEISTKYGVAVHILGYYVHGDAPGMRALLDWIVADRDSRNEKMCALMEADGLPVHYAEMKERFGAVIGRPNFGQVLVELGLAESVNDAFARYVDRGQRYYVPRTILPIEQRTVNSGSFSRSAWTTAFAGSSAATAGTMRRRCPISSALRRSTAFSRPAAATSTAATSPTSSSAPVSMGSWTCPVPGSRH